MPSISRRDFLNGVALTVASGLTPAAQIAAEPLRYPPALTGLRGQHAGSFETAHAQAREGKRFSLDRLPVEERYDLVVVGAGISGLAAAAFYRHAAGPSARILALDGRLVIGYGGSESIDSPKTHYSDVAKGLLRDLGVEIERFETAFERTLYPSLGLSRGVFFAREAFGRDVLVPGEPPGGRTDELSRRLANAKPLREFVAAFPISSASKAQLLALYDDARDPLTGKTAEEKLEILKRTSYRDYLTGPCGCSEEAANCFQGRTLGFFGLGCDAVPAGDARELGYPGFDGLRLPAQAPTREPYIYHFPDGNASLARLLVRSLVPDVAQGRRRGAGGVRLRQARPRRPRGAHPPRFDLRRRPQRRRQRAHRLRSGGSAASHRGQARRARLLPHGHSAHHAHARLAPMGAARGARHLRADVVSQPPEARFSRQSRRLSPRPRPIRADLPSSRSRSGCPQPRARCTRAVSHRAGAAARHDVCGFRGAHPRRARSHARAGRIFQRARHRGDHREPLAARLRLCGELALRRGRL